PGKSNEADEDGDRQTDADPDHLLDARIAELAESQGEGFEHVFFPVLPECCQDVGETRGMRNVTSRQILTVSLVLACLRTAAADPAEAEALMGSWCDETGYRLDLGPD